jgi:choline dehydrogenase-like flavoprotein
VFLSKLRARPNVTFLTGTPVVDLIGDANHPRRIVGVRLRDGRTLQGDAVLLAAGALHSPRLLSRYLGASGIGTTIASANVVGRNLKLHLLTAVLAVSPSRKTDLIRKTTLLLNDRFPHSSVQPLGFDGELIGTLVPRTVPRFIARQVGQHAYGFFLQTEDGSHPDNRVIDTVPLPTLDYDAARLTAASREHRALVSAFRLALGKAGLLAFSQRVGLAGTAHACGTLVTGTNPSQSVVDPYGLVHGMEGLYVVDGSVLPRSSRVNPSLTIYSWSLRTARALAQRLNQRPTASARAVAV